MAATNCHNGTTMIMRGHGQTTTLWHTRLMKMVGKAHPNVFEVFEVMRKEQASSEMKLEQLELGDRAPPRKKRCIEKDNWISALFQRFKDGQYSLSNYLDAIKYQTGL